MSLGKARCVPGKDQLTDGNLLVRLPVSGLLSDKAPTFALCGAVSAPHRLISSALRPAGRPTAVVVLSAHDTPATVSVLRGRRSRDRQGNRSLRADLRHDE